MKGGLIECPKHNGRFHLADGSPARAPICRGLATYPIEERAAAGSRSTSSAPGGVGRPRAEDVSASGSSAIAAWPRSSRNWFWSPLMAEGESPSPPATTCRFDIPAYDAIRFRDFDIPQPFAAVWENQHVFDLVAQQSRAAAAATTIRSPAISRSRTRCASTSASPPRRPARTARRASARATSSTSSRATTSPRSVPSGTFTSSRPSARWSTSAAVRAWPPSRAPLPPPGNREDRAEGQLLVRRALPAGDLLRGLLPAARHDSTVTSRFHLALSSPLPEDSWTGHSGFIHEVVLEQYLREHDNPKTAEYYLCGPPMMIKACTKMLKELGVPASQIAFDEF